MILKNSLWCGAGFALVLIMSFGGQVRAQESATLSGQIVMNVIEIKGKVERPQAVYIINLARPEIRGITLDKNFLENIKDEEFSGMSTFSVDGNLSTKMLLDESIPVTP